MPLFERSAATDTLVELLATCPEGEVITWEEMCRVTNRSINGKDRHLIDSARRIALAKYNAAFGTIVRTGLRRLIPGEHAVEGRRRVKLIGGAARRGSKVMKAADLSLLRGEDALAHGTIATVLSSIETTASMRLKRIPPSTGGNKDPVMPETS